MELKNDILHQVTQPITDFSCDQRFDEIRMQMLRFMQQHRGIGLAAPQIGLDLRMFVMAIYGTPYFCFNPRIVQVTGDLVETHEACLSFSGKTCKIKRYDRIIAGWQKFNGEYEEKELVGLPAICFQHELDHLDGITMLDREKEQSAKQS